MMDTKMVGVSSGVDLLHGQLSELDVRPDPPEEAGEHLVIEPSEGRHAGSIATAITDVAAHAATMAAI